MSSKPLPVDLPIHTFQSSDEFQTFLEREHATAPGIYLKFAKKASGIPSITGAEAVETALCFGWIDGRANGLDNEWWLVRYTPRRNKSIWSQKNVGTVAKLIEDGRMRPAGLAAVDAAKADGRWERAYAGPATIKVPKDLSDALSQSPTSSAFFRSLNKSEQYAVLWRIETASTNTRSKRIKAMVEMMEAGQVPGRPEKSTTKTRGVKKRQTTR